MNDDAMNLGARAVTEAVYVKASYAIIQAKMAPIFDRETKKLGRPLQGTVTRFWQIAPSGKVFNVRDVKAEGPDAQVISQILTESFVNLEFSPLGKELALKFPNGLAQSNDFVFGIRKQ